MIDVAEVVSSWIYALRITSVGQWALRLTALAAGVLAVLLVLGWVPVVLQSVWLVLTVVLLLGSAVRPDSVAPLLVAVMVVLAWLADGAAATWWVQLAVVALVGIHHLVSAYAAAAPSYAALVRP